MRGQVGLWSPLSRQSRCSTGQGIGVDLESVKWLACTAIAVGALGCHHVQDHGGPSSHPPGVMVLFAWSQGSTWPGVLEPPAHSVVLLTWGGTEALVLRVPWPFTG